MGSAGGHARLDADVSIAEGDVAARAGRGGRAEAHRRPACGGGPRPGAGSLTHALIAFVIS